MAGMPALDLAGRTFGRLTVIKRAKVSGARNAMWLCHCECGQTTIAAAANIGRTTFSCGCLAKETAAELLRGNHHTQTHGRTGTPEYTAWSRMKLRCYDPNNPKYYRYGARGIAVCERWRESFENFYADMGPRPSSKHSLGRKNNDGPYSPQNCRWETPYQQLRNFSRNRIVTIDGTSRCVSEWCEVLGIDRHKVQDLTRVDKRYNRPPKFKTTEEALTFLYRSKFGAA